MGLGVTIRMNAARDEVVFADGSVVDRSQLDKSRKRKLKRIVRGIFERKQNEAT